MKTDVQPRTTYYFYACCQTRNSLLSMLIFVLERVYPGKNQDLVAVPSNKINTHKIQISKTDFLTKYKFIKISFQTLYSIKMLFFFSIKAYIKFSLLFLVQFLVTSNSELLEYSYFYHKNGHQKLKAGCLALIN